MASSAPRGLRSDHVVTVGIALFSMLFGAGNLIIPPLLALQAGSATPVAMLGFLIAAIGLPVMGFIAVALAGTARELAGRVHPKFGEFFVAAVYLAIGPCLAIPRTSSTAFEMLVPLLPQGVSLGTARLVFAVGFFVVAFALTLRPGVITRVLGRITGPALIVLIVLVNDAERRLPVQYSKRVVGRKMYGGQSTHLPMKVNMSGVLPIIFAQSIASLPATICAFVPKWQSSWIMKHVFDTTTWPYIVLYFLLIIFFSYFYSTIQFNPIEVANNLKKNGGFIPGFRAGKPTSEFIQKVLNKITLFGAIYLSVIAITPLIISACSKAEQLTGISLGGTSIIIVVGVALETVRALEAQMLMRNYKGFLS